MMSTVPEMTVQELKALMDEDKTPFLLDVRQQHEHDFVNLKGILIPLQELPNRLDELEDYRDQLMVVYCRSGARSGRAVEFMQAMGFEHAINLKGGVLAWSNEIDPSMPTY